MAADKAREIVRAAEVEAGALLNGAHQKAYRTSRAAVALALPSAGGSPGWVAIAGIAILGSAEQSATGGSAGPCSPAACCSACSLSAPSGLTAPAATIAGDFFRWYPRRQRYRCRRGGLRSELVGGLSAADVPSPEWSVTASRSASYRWPPQPELGTRPP